MQSLGNLSHIQYIVTDLFAVHILGYESLK